MKNILILSLLMSSFLLLGSCTPKLVSSSVNARPIDDLVMSEILVKLKESFSPRTLENDFAQYNLQLNAFKSKLEEGKDVYIFSFDGKKISISEMLIEIVKHAGVAEANFVEVTEID